MTSPFLDWLWDAGSCFFGRKPGDTIGLRAGCYAATFPLHERFASDWRF
jgi:hypothetical protein